MELADATSIMGSNNPERLSSAFTSLPIDMMIEVLSRLDIRDILSFRQVSHALNSISRERAVWVSLLSQQQYGKTLHLLKPLACHSTVELEGMVKRLQCLNRNWKSVDPKPYREQDIALNGGADVIRDRWSYVWYKILPGGRWMLSMLKCSDLSEGIIFYWDLDHATSQPLPLLSTDSIISPLHRVHLIDCCISPDDNPYSFDVVVTTISKDSSPVGAVHIWHVCYVQSSDRLEASLSLSFIREGETPSHLVFDQQHLSYVVRINKMVTIVTFDWRMCHDVVCFTSCFLIESSILDFVHLLPYRRTMCSHRDKICIYQRPDAKKSTTPLTPEALVPLWIISLKTPLNRPTIFLPGFQQIGNLQFIVVGDKMVMKVTVPIDASDPLDIISNYPSRSRVLTNHRFPVFECTGYYRAVKLNSMSIYLSDISSLDASIMPVEKLVQGQTNSLYRRIAFDEESGRVGLLHLYKVRILYF